MAVSIKSEREIELMRESGRILSIVHTELAKMIKPGISTLDIDKRCYEIIRDFNCIPSFLNYQGYPASVCVSVNDEVVHGIPNKNRILKDGDIVKVDVGAFYHGYHGDSANTFACGNISEEAKRLIEATKESFYRGVANAVVGKRLGDVGSAVEEYNKSCGFSVVREFVGHGIGRDLHEDPNVPNFGTAGRGPRLVPGMTIAVEPMVNIGTYKVNTLSDDWTVVTADGSLSAHYENTVLITEGEPILLTLSK